MVDGGGTIADGLYTSPSDNSSVIATATAAAEGISGTAEIKGVGNDEAGAEFHIGAFDVAA